MTKFNGKVYQTAQWTFLWTVYLIICQRIIVADNSREIYVSTAVLNTNQTQGLTVSDESNVTVSVAISPSRGRRRRDLFHLYTMMTCATNCDPLSYKGYGCYCGYLGSGITVDGIDRCCKLHDYCYGTTSCHQSLIYFIPYKWKCNGGRPYCVMKNGALKGSDLCSHHLCECDRQFAECIRHYPCPARKATCLSNPWRSLG